MICKHCGQKVGDGIMVRFIHDTETCPNKTFNPIPAEYKQAWQALEKFIDDLNNNTTKLKVISGQGVYINTIDEPNIVVIPDEVIKHLEK